MTPPLLHPTVAKTTADPSCDVQVADLATGEFEAPRHIGGPTGKLPLEAAGEAAGDRQQLAPRSSFLQHSEDHWPLGIALLAAASRSRSRRRRRGRFTCRCSTLTWCRSTRSSISLPSSGRRPIPRTRPTRK